MNTPKISSIVLAIGLSASAFAQQTETKTITVTGDGKNKQTKTYTISSDGKKTETSTFIVTADGKGTGTRFVTITDTTADPFIGEGSKVQKMTVLVDGDKVTINGKPADQFNEADLKGMLHHKIMLNMEGKDGMSMHLPEFSIDTNKTTTKAFLGVATEKADQGVRIVELSKESPAAKAGLKEQDIITKINETAIGSPEELVDVIGKMKPDNKISVSFLRDGKANTASAVLGKKITNTSVRVFKSDGSNFNFNMPPMPREFPFESRMGFPIKPRLGIKIEDLEEGNGVKIIELDEDLPAGKAGLKAQDIVTDVNGAAVKSVDEMRAKIKDLKEGDTIKFGIKRNGKAQTIEVKLPKKLKTANL